MCLLDNKIRVSIDDDYFYFSNTDFNIYQACLASGIYLPRFCYHNKLKIAGNCRICLIEDAKAPKPLISCAVLINKDQLIFTKTSLVKQAQEGVMEYLLVNHPLDCPICDQGGECDLQDQSLVYGSDRGRFYEPFKRAVTNSNYGPLIKFVLNRCIHCARCTRFLSDYSSDNTITFINRGHNTQISSYIKKYIESEVSGNIIDLCPVGALTSKPFAFTARVWELNFIKHVDAIDSFNSSIKIDIRGLNVMRVLPYINEALNEEWIPDNIRFFVDSIESQRLLKPFFIYKNKKLHAAWLKILLKIKTFFVDSLKTNYLKKIKQMHAYSILPNSTDAIFANNLKYFLQSFNFLYNNKDADDRSTFLSLNDYNNIFDETSFMHNNFNTFTLIGINLRFESPILNLKMKNFVDYQDEPIQLEILGFLSNFNHSYNHIGNNIKLIAGTASAFKNKILLIGTSFYNKVLYSYFNLSEKFKTLLIHFNAASFLYNELNLSDKKSLLLLSNKVFNAQSFLIYSFNNDDPINLMLNSTEGSMTVYQGTHGDYMAGKSNLVLPTKLFFERSSYYVNTFGLVQNLASFFFNCNFKKVKLDVDILNILPMLFSSKKKKQLQSYYKSLTRISPVFLSKIAYNSIPKYSMRAIDILAKLKIPNILFISAVNNYYKRDAITRASKALSLCSKLYTSLNDFKFIMLNFID